MTRRLALIPCLGALVALPACIVTHGLGETAEATGGSDDASGGETNPDPSATSGQSGTTAEPTSEGTSGGSDETTAGTDDSTTDTGEPGCEQDPDYVLWQPNGTSFSPLAGVDAAFVAILVGECTVGEIVVAEPKTGDPVWSVPLQCSLAGRFDGALVEDDFAPVIEMTGSVPPTEVVASIGQDVRLRVVLDWWGMGWNGWVVLERLDGTMVLDLVDAEYLDPTSSTWGEQVLEALAGESWHGALALGVADAQCGGPETKCNDEPRAIEVGSLEETPLLLHPWQEGLVGTGIEELQYRVSVTSASATPMPTCTDQPLASYRVAGWAVEP